MISLSCTTSSRLQPTPQSGQIACVTVWLSSSQWPLAQLVLARGHQRAGGADAMPLPQYTHAESGGSTANSVEMRASKPRPATVIANVF